MSARTPEETRDVVGALYRHESGRILATLIRIFGDFDVAEDVVQEAFAAALEQWPQEGTPSNPRAWIIQAAKFKAINRLERQGRYEQKLQQLGDLAFLEGSAAEDVAGPVHDDQLRLIFTCCHPALSSESQVPLALRAIRGMTTEEIARAFLMPAPTMAQRLVRAKHKIRAARIPYEVPGPYALPERLDAVMSVVYLLFNGGYAASTGQSRVRDELCDEAVRLGRLLVMLLPDRAELKGLLALMLLHDSRRAARVGPGGDIVLLEDQDRGRWDRAKIRDGLELVEAALRAGRPGRYSIQAAIAALHARAETPEQTDWRQIAALYSVLLRVDPSPVVELNRAVAIAMADGPEHGLQIVERLRLGGQLKGFHLLHAARADFLRRLGRWSNAAESYRRALSLATSEPERRFLERRVAEMDSKR